MKPDVVIATAVPTLADGGEGLLQIARWLTRRGLRVEIIALGEGTRPHLERFRAVAPTTVVDRFRRRGVAALPHLLGMRTAARGWKTMRLRRWLRHRSDATFLIHHPLAASLLRYASRPPHRVVAALPDSSWSLERLRDEDRDTLVDVAGWIVADDDQAGEIARWSGDVAMPLGDALTGGTVVDPADLPPVSTPPEGAGAVVLLPTIGLWDAADHAVEIAWKLQRAAPDVEIRWVADGEDDDWLARHDIAHCAMGDAVRVTASTDPGLLQDVGVVVRTGYEPAYGDLALAAALGGVPVRGMCTADLPASARPAEPFDVDGLVADILHLVDDPEARRKAGQELRSELSHLDLEHHISAIAELLCPGRT